MLDDILNATIESTNGGSNGNGGARIVSENHNANSINWVRGMSDPGEMISCGFLPELRRRRNENDAMYAARIMPLIDALPADQREKIMAAGTMAAKRRANLFTTADGKIAVMVAGVAAWHELGINVSEAVNRADMLRLAQLANWNLQKVPLYTQDGKEAGCFGIVRSSDGVVLSYGKSVGDRYTLFSNEDGAEFVDDIFGQAGAKYATAGALGNGATVWMLANLPKDIQVAKGYDMRQYLLAGLNHDGSASVWFMPTNECVVCANTMRIATSEDGHKRFSFRHTKNAHQRAKEVAKALGIATRKQAEFAETAKRLATTPLPDHREYFFNCLDDIVDVTIAETKVNQQSLNSGELLRNILAIEDIAERNSAEKALERVKAQRKDILDDILERHESERCNGIPSIAGSAWSAFNAVTEYADHSSLVRYRGSANERAESRMVSTLEGRADDIKQSALERIIELAK